MGKNHDKVNIRGDDMLEINMECRRGILFVRLEGELVKETVEKLNHEVTELVKEAGIRNIVFNIERLSAIDMKGISTLFYNYELCKNNKGKSMLCGVDKTAVKQKILNSRILKYMSETSDELSACRLFEISNT